VRTAPWRPRFRSRSSWIFAPSKRPQMASGRQLVHDFPPTGTSEYFVGSRYNVSSERGSKTNTRLMTPRENFAFSRPSSKITRMSSPGFQWRVRGLVRAALLDDSGQTNACCALLVTPTRGPERLEGCAQPPHQQERTRPEVAGSARHQAAATRSESVKSTDRGKYIARIEQGTYTPS